MPEQIVDTLDSLLTDDERLQVEIQADMVRSLDLELQRMRGAIDWEKEARLFDKKWWDNRLLHPGEAIIQCVRNYGVAYQDMLKRRHDVVEAQFKRGFGNRCTSLAAFAKHREAASFAHLRQTIDELGLPYLFYIRAAFKYADGSRWKQHLPRPNHLQTEEFKLAALRAWKDQLRGGIVLPEHPFFIEPESLDNPLHRLFQGWLCRRIKTRVNPHFALADYVYGLHRTPLIAEGEAAKYFDASVLQRAYRETLL
jgi:hypothetical protein